MLMYISAIVFFAIEIAVCDYKCLCNYNDGKIIYSALSTKGTVLGYMPVYDCKAVPGSSGTDGWIMIAFEHQLGYVENDTQLQLHTCQGNVPDEDKLIIQTTIAKTTVNNSTPTSETKTDTLTTNGTVTVTIDLAKNLSTLDITTQDPTTSTVSSMDTPSTMSSMDTPSTMSSMDTPSTMSSMDTPSTMLVTMNSRMTDVSASSDKTILKNSTINPVIRLTNSYTNVFNMIRTTTSMQTPVMTTSSSVKGRIELCPIRIKLQANGDTGIKLAQFGNKCYEIVQRKVPWTQAENSCQTNKGHLVDIANQQEQDFLYNFLTNIRSHTVWLGLHDSTVEENFVWTSGSPVTYTYWKVGRKEPFYHQKQDCVYMTVNGTWDNINCGNDNLPYYYRHAYVCQYDTVNGAQIVG